MFLLKNKEPITFLIFTPRYRRVLDGVRLAAFSSVLIQIVVYQECNDGGYDCGYSKTSPTQILFDVDGFCHAFNLAPKFAFWLCLSVSDFGSFQPGFHSDQNAGALDPVIFSFGLLYFESCFLDRFSRLLDIQFESFQFLVHG